MHETGVLNPCEIIFADILFYVLPRAELLLSQYLFIRCLQHNNTLLISGNYSSGMESHSNNKRLLNLTKIKQNLSGHKNPSEHKNEDKIGSLITIGDFWVLQREDFL